MSAKVYLIVAAVITAIPLVLSQFFPSVEEWGDKHPWIYGIAIFWVLFALPAMQKYENKKKSNKKDSTTS